MSFEQTQIKCILVVWELRCSVKSGDNVQDIIHLIAFKHLTKINFPEGVDGMHSLIFPEARAVFNITFREIAVAPVMVSRHAKLSIQ